MKMHIARVARQPVLALAALSGVTLLASSAGAGVIFNFSGATLGGGSRWDAAPRTITVSGTPVERSLNGGLRYSLQGASYTAYRDLFAWTPSVPSVAAFTTAVDQAFAAWTATDPGTGSGTGVSFVSDLATPVVGFNTGAGGLDGRGAEIDLFGSNDAGFWNVGNTGT